MTVDLTEFSFDGAPDGKHLLITGGVHGDEFEPIAAIRRLIELFKQGDPEVSSFRGRVTLVPIVNEAAFLRGDRCADDGLDLARTCPGQSDGSVTEQTAWALANLIRRVDYYIDLHTGGTELSVFPLAGYMLHADEKIRQTQRQMAMAFNLPVVWGTSPEFEGRSLSVARDAGVPAIYCEYLGAATCDPTGIKAYVTGCLNVMSELTMLERTRAISLVKHRVENHQPASGHMQVCNPSPVTGFFAPQVKLGDIIEAGDVLGSVHPMDGGAPVNMRSNQTGIVLVLRTFPRVHAGESVGVIMDLPSSNSSQ
jgi:predicted deacylase